MQKSFPEVAKIFGYSQSNVANVAYLTRTVLGVYTKTFGSVPCGTYFLGGPVLVPLAVLYGTQSPEKSQLHG